MIAGRYGLEREIGRGGTGVVWLGRDELLGRQVALKRIGLLPGADATDLALAEREARLSARLTHPHVVAVFDAVVEEDTGAHWLVMEYVEGTDLGRLVRDRGALPPDEAARLLGQAADALLAAHAAGITHRDVKPSNILLARDGTVKLTDFGIARVTTDPALTQTGLVTGSPSYLAPEVAAGARGDAAADVWSLGATAYHVLAGRPPYDLGDNVLGALYRIVNEDPPRLPGAGPMTALLDGTMVRDPERRWTMAQVRDFLDRPGAEVTPASGPESDTEPGTEPTRLLTVPVPSVAPPVPTAAALVPAATERRRRITLLAGLGALAVIVLGAIGYATLSGGDGSPDATHSPAARPTTSAPAGPTVRGMEAFIRDYVATVSADPAAAWTMLTPKFQRESGGFASYRRFWDAATNGRVLSISADPAALRVSYQVHFDDFHNGPGPTILDLAYTGGHYLIDGEHTRGFEPATADTQGNQGNRADNSGNNSGKATKADKPDKKHGKGKGRG
jgi:predicted Ser/Thr protein kinase